VVKEKPVTENKHHLQDPAQPYEADNEVEVVTPENDEHAPVTQVEDDDPQQSGGHFVDTDGVSND
jgi:hypothetical protein